MFWGPNGNHTWIETHSESTWKLQFGIKQEAQCGIAKEINSRETLRGAQAVLKGLAYFSCSFSSEVHVETHHCLSKTMEGN